MKKKIDYCEILQKVSEEIKKKYENKPECMQEALNTIIDKYQEMSDEELQEIITNFEPQNQEPEAILRNHLRNEIVDLATQNDGRLNIEDLKKRGLKDNQNEGLHAKRLKTESNPGYPAIY